MSLPYLRVKAKQYVVSSSRMFLDKKTLLKIWLNPGLNLTTFRGTRHHSTLYTTMSEILPTHQFSSGPKGPSSGVGVQANKMFTRRMWRKGETAFRCIIFRQNNFHVGIFNFYMHANTRTRGKKISNVLIIKLCLVFSCWKRKVFPDH